jgi:hypothetical protein
MYVVPPVALRVLGQMLWPRAKGDPISDTNTPIKRKLRFIKVF